MALPNLADKFLARLNANKIPFILGGPILRHVDKQSVTVWIALRVPKRVNLQIIDPAGGAVLAESGLTDPVKLGEKLFVLAVTARPTLQPNKIYTYDLRFAGVPASPESGGLLDEGFLFTSAAPKNASALVGYSTFNRPSFMLPAATADNLRIVHGSCRKPHGESVDAFATLDDMLIKWQSDLNQRPQQLFLTGDQIYADEVAAAMLAFILDIVPVLIGKPELLPEIQSGSAPGETSSLAPETRRSIIEQIGFTTGAGQNHVLSFGEYAVMYLLVYSDVLWPAAFPEYGEVFPGFPATETVHDEETDTDETGLYWAAKVYGGQRRPLETFKRSLPKVRRALANIPTYMILDDHDITDDFLMNGRFVGNVFGATGIPAKGTLGRRILLDGLAAFAAFQGWGNVGNPTGATTVAGDVRPAMNALGAWVGASYPTTGNTIDALGNALGLPTAPLSVPADGATSLGRLVKPAGAVRWDFYLAWDAHELFALDCRTQRGYVHDPLQSPAIVDETIQPTVLGAPAPTQPLTFVIATKSVITLPYVEFFQQPPLSPDATFRRDPETWRLDPTSLEFLLSSLASRGDKQRHVVMLSGDTHYGFVYRTQYWATRALSTQPRAAARATFALLTSSALKNETAELPSQGTEEQVLTTRYQHEAGFRPLLLVVTPIPQSRVMMALTWIAEGQDLNADTVKLGRERIVQALGPGSPPTTTDTDFTAHRSRQVIIDPDFRAILSSGATTTTVTSLTRTPDSIAKHSFVRGVVNAPAPGKKIDTAPSGGSARVTTWLDGTGNHRNYRKKTGPGNEIVGVNNIALVRFERAAGTTDANGLRAVQELWWRSGDAVDLYDADDGGQLQLATPNTIFVVPLAIEAQPDPLTFTGS